MSFINNSVNYDPPFSCLNGVAETAVISPRKRKKVRQKEIPLRPFKNHPRRTLATSSFKSHGYTSSLDETT
jgi:hypothetical protein